MRKFYAIGLFIGLLFFGVFLIPSIGFASLVLYQGDFSDFQTEDYQEVSQTIGLGDGSTVGSITFKANLSGYSGTPTIQIARYDNSNYTDLVQFCSQNSQTFVSETSNSTDVIAVINSCEVGDVTFSFSSSDYYIISINKGADFSDFDLLGSEFNSYSQGQVFKHSGFSPDFTNNGSLSGLSDLYFVLDTASVPSSVPAFSSQTRIIDMRPENATTTGNTVDFLLRAYLSEQDVDLGSLGMKLFLRNIDQNVLLFNFLSPSDIILFEGYVDTPGEFLFESTEVLGDGNYRLSAEISSTFGNIFGSALLDGCNVAGAFLSLVCITGNTQFIVNEGTFIGNISQNSYSQINGIFTSNTATTTANLANQCNPITNNISTAFLNTSFSTTGCLAFLFIPDSGLIYDSLYNFKTNVSTHFPLGYVTDFISIMSTSTVGTLPSFDFDTPTGFGVPPVHFEFTFDHVFDYILNASTSASFKSLGAMSDETFFEQTDFYWTILIYILTGFYILRRILGRGVIPHFK